MCEEKIVKYYFFKADQLVTDAAQFEVCCFDLRIGSLSKVSLEEIIYKKAEFWEDTFYKLNLKC